MSEFFRIIIIATLCFSPNFCLSQSISFSNGAPFKTDFCHEDNNYGITGHPSGGTFAGCGVFLQNGQWYFNPQTAAQSAAVFPHACTLEYIRNGAVIASKSIFVNKPVTIHPPLQDTFTCDGAFLLWAETLYAGDYDYEWSPATGLATPHQHQSAGSVANEQQYMVKVTDLFSGCEGSDSLTITNKSLKVSLDPDQERICPYDSFHISVQGHEPGNSYEWSYQGLGNVMGIDSFFSDRLQVPGDHVVLLAVANDKCSTTLNAAIHVIDVGLVLSVDKSLIDQGEAVTLYTNALLSYSITNWLPEYLFTDQVALTQHITPDSSRSYMAIALSDEGCIDTAKAEVKVNPVLFLPNAFSPNGDGLNDFFKPMSGGDDVIIGWFQIFNRNGQLVHSINGGAGGNSKGWDGTHNGKSVDMGTYYYYAELATPAGDFKIFKGDVTLIR